MKCVKRDYYYFCHDAHNTFLLNCVKSFPRYTYFRLKLIVYKRIEKIAEPRRLFRAFLSAHTAKYHIIVTMYVSCGLYRIIDAAFAHRYFVCLRTYSHSYTHTHVYFGLQTRMLCECFAKCVLMYTQTQRSKKQHRRC